MSRPDGINAYRRKTPNPGNPFQGKPWRRRFSAVLPWVFVVGVAAGTLLPLRQWVRGPAAVSSDPSADSQAARDAEMVWRQAGNSGVRHPVDVLRTIDGDTFEARVHLSPGLEPTTRVRLRGVDAAELKAACAGELQLAEAAAAALRGLLGEGGVTIYNIGPDKYHGRVVADVATRRTDNVSAALLAAGHVRGYGGGHRNSWCPG
jgi:endonuclease YncB( thermonuclease family)